MSDYRSLEIKVSHAMHLKNVNFFSSMSPYVVVSFSTDPKTRLKSVVHRYGNKNPTWNFSLKFAVNLADPHHLSRHTLDLIICEDGLRDKPIGAVHVLFSDLLAAIDDPKSRYVTYQVHRPSGRAKGELNFSYKWGKKLARARPPPTAVKGKAEEVIMTYPLTTGTCSGFQYPVSGYMTYSPYQSAPHKGYNYQDPPMVGYIGPP